MAVKLDAVWKNIEMTFTSMEEHACRCSKKVMGKLHSNPDCRLYISAVRFSIIYKTECTVLHIDCEYLLKLASFDQKIGIELKYHQKSLK